MLLHVESLDESPKIKFILIFPLLKVIIMSSPVTVGTLVWLLPRVDLPVPVEAAGVGQQLPALLALHCSLTIGSNHVGPADR